MVGKAEFIGGFLKNTPVFYQNFARKRSVRIKNSDARTRTHGFGAYLFGSDGKVSRITCRHGTAKT
jgi:hypothetical protein